jgi:hypothetical protein
MDLLYFLTRRLQFVQSLYDSAISPFEEKIRKIEVGESPYVDLRNPEYADEPAFLTEWQEADDSIMVVGHWCLCMVQVTLQKYLRDSISPIGSDWWDSLALTMVLGQKKGKNWFQRFRLLFFEDMDIDWEKGPVPLGDLEQLNLTRDDLIHNIDMTTFTVERAESHAERFPIGLFTDDLWRSLDAERVRIDRDKLALAIRLVTDFCAWLDRIRCEYPSYLKAVDAGEPWPPTD